MRTTRPLGALLAMFCWPVLAAAPRLEQSGAIGQSQPADAPLPWLGANGAVVAGGRLWTAAGATLYGFDPGRPEAPLVAERIVLPAPVGSLGMRWDGQRLFYPANGRLYAVELSTRQAAPWGEAKVAEQLRSFAVAPVGLTAGFAARGKLFLLEGDRVDAFDAEGTPCGTVLTLQRPAEAKWHYGAVGIEPTTGDLLVGSYYPDAKVYRFAADGREVTVEGWPRSGHAAAFESVDGRAWLLRYGTGAMALPLARPRGAAGDSLGAEWSMYVSGLAADPAGFWLAGSQGLVRYDALGRPVGLRLGGLPGVRALAIAGDGTVIAAVENGQRMVRFGLDDGPLAPPRSNANEPWRTGAGWSSRTASLAWDGERFLAVDEVAGRLWSFDPWHTAWRETPWTGLTPPKCFGVPRAVAAGDMKVYVIDGARLLEATRPGLDSWQPVELPGVDPAEVVGLAATGDGLLYLALPRRVVAFARSDGVWRQKWEAGFGPVAAIAAGEGLVAVAEAEKVVVMDAEEGKPAAEAGPFRASALAVSGPWVLIADVAGHRLVRLRWRAG